MIRFEVNGNHYQMQKLSAIAQLHVFRRISPLLPTLVPIFVEMAKNADEEGKELKPEDFARLAVLAGPLTDGLASMTDKDAEFVVNACLGDTKIERAGTWVPFWSAVAKKSMIDEMNDVGTYLPVVIAVIQETFAGFFAGLPTSGQSSVTKTA